MRDSGVGGAQRFCTLVSLGVACAVLACSRVSTVNEGRGEAGGVGGGAGSGGTANSGGANQGGSAGSGSGSGGGSAAGGSSGNGNGGDAGGGNAGTSAGAASNGGSSGSGGSSGTAGTSGALPSAEWYRQFGSAGDDAVLGIGRAPNGDVMVLGYVAGALPGQVWYGQTDPFLRRYDSEGNEIWTRQWGTSDLEGPTALAVDRQGDLYVAARLSGATTIQKYNADGSKSWTGDMGGNLNNTLNRPTIDASNNLYVVGKTGGNLGGHTQIGRLDAFIWKYSPLGDDLWIEQFGTPEEDEIRDIEVETDGAIYVAGITRGQFPGETKVGTEPNAFVRKYNGSGGVVWTHQFGGTAQAHTKCVAADGQGGLYVGGHIPGALSGESQIGAQDAFVRRYDASGGVMWTLQFGTATNDYLQDCSLDQDGNLRAVGRSGNSSASAVPAVVWNVSANGSILDTRLIGDAAGEALALALLPGWLFVGGRTSDTLPGQSASGGYDAFVAALVE